MIFDRVKLRNKWIILFCLLLVLIVYLFLQNNWIKVQHIETKIDNLPNELKGLKIAHISDVHLPNNASSFEKLIELVKKENPDIIILTGDIIDKRANLDRPLLGEFCKGLANITDTYAVS